jgi:hypothetical protein
VTRAQNSIAEVWYTRDAHSYFFGSLYKFCSVMSSSDHAAVVRHRAVELDALCVRFAIYSVVNERVGHADVTQGPRTLKTGLYAY